MRRKVNFSIDRIFRYLWQNYKYIPADRIFVHRKDSLYTTANTPAANDKGKIRFYNKELPVDIVFKIYFRLIPDKSEEAKAIIDKYKLFQYHDIPDRKRKPPPEPEPIPKKQPKTPKRQRPTVAERLLNNAKTYNRPIATNPHIGVSWFKPYDAYQVRIYLCPSGERAQPIFFSDRQFHTGWPAPAEACGCRKSSGQTSPAPLLRVIKTRVQAITARPSGNATC
jgi:hypothetical protein